jgi:hypothetical protein
VKTFGQPLLIPHAFRILGPINCESQASGICRGLVLNMAIGNSGRGASGNAQFAKALPAKSASRAGGTASVSGK